ncbi:MAG: type IV secretion system protein VirB4 [Bacteroidota bacterium]
MKTRHFPEILPYLEITHDVLILKDGRVAVGMALQGEEMEKQSAAHYQAFNRTLQASLKSLPVGTTLQKLDAYFHQPFQVPRQDKGYFELKQLDHFYNRPILQHQSYLFLAIGAPDQPKANPVNSFFAFGRPLLKNPLHGLAERVEKVERLAEELMQLFHSVGMPIQRMDSAALRALMDAYFNLDFAERQVEGTIQRKIQKHKQGMALGEKQVHLLSLIGQGVHADPVCYRAGLALPFISPLTHYLEIPHLLISSIRIENRDKELKKLDLERKLNASLDFLSTQDNEVTQSELEAFTAEVRVNNDQIVSLNVSVLLWNNDRKGLQTQVDKAVSAFRSMQGAETLIESIDTTNLFLSLAPGNVFQNYRWLLMRAENALCYFHFITGYKAEREGLYLCDRFHNPLLVRLFNSDLNNQNAIVVGPSGSGKSFSVGSFIVQRYEQGYRQIIIDNGGTYKNAMTALDGQYFEYDPAHPISFNPFLLRRTPEGKFHLDGDKLTFLTSLLATLWKGGGVLSQAERSVFSVLIPAFYQEIEADVPRLADFYHWLENYDEAKQDDPDYKRIVQNFDIDQFLITLKPFVDGEYRQVLNATSEIDITEYPLVAFDMARIKSNQLLYPIVALLITDLALSQVRKFPDDRKFIYMDEAWSMLSESMGEFVELMYRTIRKNNGSMCIITQGVEEITRSSVGAAIIANAATQIILNHNDDSQISRVGEAFGFTEHEVAKIRSIRVGLKWREIFVKQGDYAKVYSLEASPHLSAVLSSKPEDRNHLARLIDAKPTTEHALNQYLEEKQHGLYH